MVRPARCSMREAGVTTAHEGATHFGSWQTMKRVADGGRKHH